ncbi:MAG: hypothetical protein U5J97_08150 [Trueperaceae bacterium]|nr:hypothetical protein [Trueperaceae bacterium]
MSVVEPARGQLDPGQDLLRRAVGVAALHLTKQLVVQALDPDRQPVHASVEHVENVVGQVVRVRLGRHLAHAEQLTGQVDRRDQLLRDHGRRAASYVHRGEVVAQVGHHPHLFAKRVEVAGRRVLLERKAVERAVRAESMAERDVRVQQIATVMGRLREIARLVGLQAKLLRP